MNAMTACKPIVRALCCAAIANLVTGCSGTGQKPAPVADSMHPKQIVKSDIDRVLEAHHREIFASLERLADKLYKRNPREWRRAGLDSREAAMARLFAAQHRTGGFGQHQCAIGFVIDAGQPERNQLTENTAPQIVVLGLADAMHAQLVMSPLADALGVLATQHVDQVGDAEAIAGAVDCGQRLLCGDRRVPGFRRRKAVVAVAAGLPLLSEIGEQMHAPALRRFAQAEQRVELAAGDATEGFAAL